MQTKFVDFAFCLGTMYMPHIQKLQLWYIKSCGQKISSVFFCAFGWPNFSVGA